MVDCLWKFETLWRFLGIIGQGRDPSVSKSNRLHDGVIFLCISFMIWRIFHRFFQIWLVVYLQSWTLQPVISQNQPVHLYNMRSGLPFIDFGHLGTKMLIFRMWTQQRTVWYFYFYPKLQNLLTRLRRCMGEVSGFEYINHFQSILNQWFQKCHFIFYIFVLCTHHSSGDEVCSVALPSNSIWSTRILAFGGFILECYYGVHEHGPSPEYYHAFERSVGHKHQSNTRLQYHP